MTAGRPIIHHSILGAIANGSVTAGKIAKRLGRSVPGIDTALRRLFAPAFTSELATLADRRTDVELVDLDRLYHGT